MRAELAPGMTADFLKAEAGSLAERPKGLTLMELLSQERNIRLGKRLTGGESAGAGMKVCWAPTSVCRRFKCFVKWHWLSLEPSGDEAQCPQGGSAFGRWVRADPAGPPLLPAGGAVVLSPAFPAVLRERKGRSFQGRRNLNMDLFLGWVPF